MKKGLILAAALSALAFTAVGPSSAAPLGGQLGAAAQADTQLAQPVHYKRYKHSHNRRWNHNRRWKKNRRYRHCAFRVGRRVCVWRWR